MFDIYLDVAWINENADIWQEQNIILLKILPSEISNFPRT